MTFDEFIQKYPAYTGEGKVFRVCAARYNISLEDQEDWNPWWQVFLMGVL